MNIFVTSKCPKQSAMFLDDKRVVKMSSESVQILVTALSIHSKSIDLPIKPTHANHPVVKWAATSRQNYKWLLRHAVALMHEKRKRYPDNPYHKYESHVDFLRKNVHVLPDFMLTPFQNSAANKGLGIDYTHVSDTLLAYKLYLNDRWNTDKRSPTWYRD